MRIEIVRKNPLRFLILISLFALSLAGCAKTESIYLGKPNILRGAEKNRSFLVGKWLGEAFVKEGGSKMWLNERSVNGTYVITFRNLSPHGEIELSQEYGVWGMSGDIYFTKMQGWISGGRRHPSEVTSSYVDDAYVVKTLTATEFIYQAVTTNEVFHTKKVADDYTLPKMSAQ